MSVRSRYRRHYYAFEDFVRNVRGFVDNRQVELHTTYRTTFVGKRSEVYLGVRMRVQDVLFLLIVREHVSELVGKFQYVVANRSGGVENERGDHDAVVRYEGTLD